VLVARRPSRKLLSMIRWQNDSPPGLEQKGVRRRALQALHLMVHPGCMMGCVVEDDTMRRVTQESRPGLHGLQNARLALGPQVHVEIRLIGHIAHQ
jgi:hypothetical protein